MMEQKEYILTVSIKSKLPIEAIKEDLAMYCEKMGDVRVINIIEKDIDDYDDYSKNL